MVGKHNDQPGEALTSLGHCPRDTMNNAKPLLMSLVLLALAFMPTASADKLDTDAFVIGDGPGDDRPICDDRAVVATNCYYCPEYSSSREYCANHPEDQAWCTYMVRGVCIISDNSGSDVTLPRYLAN